MHSVKKKMMAGETVLGTMISEFSCPNLVRILKISGFDFVVIDAEHGYFDFSELAAMAAVGNGFDMPIIVRVPVAEREFVTKVFDMGCDGILVPMVNTPEDSAKAASFAKYMPIGKRGLSTTRAHTNYTPPPLKEYLPIANDRTMVIAQIETKQAVDNAPEIANVPGVDALMIGPNDLAADLGHPGELQTGDMKAAFTCVVEAARTAGKACGIIDSSIPFLHDCQKLGMNIFSCSSEVGMLFKAAKNTVAEFKK